VSSHNLFSLLIEIALAANFTIPTKIPKMFVANEFANFVFIMIISL